MQVTLKEPIITMSLSQYEALKIKAKAADTKAGVIKQAVMRRCLEEPYMLKVMSCGDCEIDRGFITQHLDPLEIKRQYASKFADEVLKWLHLTED